MKVKKASPGLDQRNRLKDLLGDGFTFEEYDGTRPLESQVGEADVLLVRDVAVPAKVIDAAPRLKLIQRPGDHLREIDVVHAHRRGILVGRIPARLQGGAARDVAEHALSLLLAVAKKHGEARVKLRERVVGLPKTGRIHGKTLCLVGVGNTGAELAGLARGIGLRVTAVKRTPDEALRESLGLASLETMDALHRNLAEADFVSLHLPVTSDTAALIGRAEFAAMKPGAVLVNISRAPIVDRDALIENLEDGRLAGAALDVFWEEPMDPDDPILRFENVIATPHIAGDTYEMEERLYGMVASNVRALANGAPLENLVAPADPAGDPTAYIDIA